MLRGLLLSLILFSLDASSQWNSNPSVNNQLCADAPNLGQNFSSDHRIQWVNDGNNGAYASWFDQSNPTPMGGMDVKVQHISSTGSITWPANGLPIGTGDFNQRFPGIAADGTGGVIVTWIDDLSGLRAQRVDVNGNLLWGPSGILVSNFTGIHSSIVRNESGQFTIVWNKISGLSAQRLDINGNLLWDPAGIEICSGPIETAGYSKPQIISDGNSGAIIAWDDRRDGLFRIYVQKINSAGVVQWAPDGIRLRDQTSFFPGLTTDGNGGAILSWQTEIDGFNFREDIFCQRLDMTGTPLWTPEGINLTALTQSQTYPKIISDNNGGAIISWRDNTAGDNNRIYGQRVNAGGNRLWPINGVPVTENNSGFQKIAPDGTGGVFITWTHFFTGNVHVQRLTQSGAAFFASDGLLLTTAPAFYQEVINAGNGIGISAWVDFRNPGQVGIYASRFVAASPTPVRWISFYGKKEELNNKLTWNTVYEENNKQFIIQHSRNGISFQDLGSLPGQVFTTERTEYSFTHQAPPPGKNFYRILQQDHDGRNSFSSIILLDETLSGLRIFPNPAKDFINVNLHPGKGVLTICDALGKIVFVTGNVYPNNRVDITKFSPGYYLCRYDGKSLSFIKQ